MSSHPIFTDEDGNPITLMQKQRRPVKCFRRNRPAHLCSGTTNECVFRISIRILNSSAFIDVNTIEVHFLGNAFQIAWLNVRHIVTELFIGFLWIIAQEHGISPPGNIKNEIICMNGKAVLFCLCNCLWRSILRGAAGCCQCKTNEGFLFRMASNDLNRFSVGKQNMMGNGSQIFFL